MPKYYESITPELSEWIIKQPVFWTATAPLVGRHINISPKGLPSSSFAILSPTKVAYIDYTGSAAETISHLYENQRITILFNSFSTSPRVLRLFCFGKVIEAPPSGSGSGDKKGQRWEGNSEFEQIIKEMGLKIENVNPSARAVLVMDVWKVQTSCGFGVPIARGVSSGANADSEQKITVEFDDRETLNDWGRKVVEKGEMAKYQVTWNKGSHDGLNGLKNARRASGEKVLWWGDLVAWSRRVCGMGDAVAVGFVLGVGVAVGVAHMGKLRGLGVVGMGWWR